MIRSGDNAMPRLAVLAVVAAFAVAVVACPPAPSLAADHGGGDKKDDKKKEKDKPGQLPIPGKGERYARLPTIVLELWDKLGNFHMSSLDLLLLPDDAKCPEKQLSDKMRKALAAVSYEEYMGANPAPTIKSSMLALARKEPGCETIKDVLISKMLFR